MQITGGTPIRQGRIYALDGLRGLAAAVVLLHHSLLVFPSLAEPYFGSQPPAWTLSWWLVNTPLHLLWEGKGAVYIFFILSGLVLAKPVYVAAGSFNWRAFYPQRLVRLYFPVWAAVIFTVVTFFVIPRTSSMASEWVQHRPTDVTVSAVLKDATLLLGNGRLASPLWSLRWEILFSLLLPVFVWVAYKVRRWPVPAIAGCLFVVMLGDLLNQDILRYMPMFGIGILLLPVIESLGSGKYASSRLGSDGRLWMPMLIGGLALLNSLWFTLGMQHSIAWSAATLGLTTLGACILVAGAGVFTPARELLAARPLLWLGKISFSLYLVHEPIVIATAYAFGPGNEAFAVPVSILIAVGAGTLFFRFVEQPSYRLAKFAGLLATRYTGAAARRKESIQVRDHKD